MTWRAGTENVKGYLRKGIPLNLVSSVLKDLPASIIVLQRNPKPGEIDLLSEYIGREVYDFTETNANLEEMLALLSLLQEYVGVSNTNTHLMAGLGKTARVVIPYPAEWRWMDDGERSPWFPGFQLYRQGMMGEWDVAMSALPRDLHASLKR